VAQNHHNLNKSRLSVPNMAEVKVDPVDKLILFELIQDCRQPLIKIARAVGLPKKTVHNRIKRLEKNGIIVKYTINVNYQKFGLNRHSLYLKLKEDTKPQDIGKYIKLITGIEDVSCCYQLHELTGWKIYISVWTKTAKRYNEIQSKLSAKFCDHIKNYISFQSIRSYTYFARRLNPNKTPKVDFKEETDAIPTKDIDHKIIHELRANSKVPFLDLAKKLHITLNLLKRRIDYLTKNDVIQRFYPIIDRNKLGYTEYTYLARIDAAHDEHIEKFIKYARSDPRFVIIIKGIGYVNLYYAFLAENEAEKEEIDKKVREMLGDYILQSYHIEVEKMIS